MAKGRPRRPNILLIMADQMQWGAIAGRTECNMPNVQRIVDGGLLFDRAYTPSGICCPARAMLISGAFHWHNGVYNQVHVAPSLTRDMRDDVVTYSQRLRDAGYYLVYAGKWHASRVRTPVHFGFHQFGACMGCTPAMLEGIDVRDQDRPERLRDYWQHRVLSERIFRWPHTKPFAQWQCLAGDESRSQSAWVAGAGIRMLQEAAASGRPWHVEVQFQLPHDPYMPFKKYLDRYDPDQIPVPPSFQDDFEGKPIWNRRAAALWEPLTEQDYRDSRAHYYAYCEQLDAQIGRVLDALDATRQADNTMVVFTTDHGDMVGAHRLYGKGRYPYEECYRIPMAIRFPGRIRPGSISERLVQLHDLAHTFVSAAGAEPLPHADGRSLLPLFDEPARADWEDQILCAFYGGHYVATQRMLITERYKYVHNGFDIDEMYDLRDDPHELRNCLADGATGGVRDELRGRLLELMGRFGDPYAGGGKHGIARFLYGPGAARSSRH